MTDTQSTKPVDTATDIYLEAHVHGTSYRIELDSKWLSTVLETIPPDALPATELLLNSRQGRAIAGHVLWKGNSILASFNTKQVRRILAFWLPHWSLRSTWNEASTAVEHLVHEKAHSFRATPPACWMVALPRSGSNHVMHVLASMAKGKYLSIYGLGWPGGQASATVVRSHALTPDLFNEELVRFTGQPWNEQTTLLALVRDPRDIAISFYEYAQVTLGVEIRQEEFLQGVDYYLASGIDIGSVRRSMLAPRSIAQGMRQFICNWLAAESQNDNVHLVRYEELLDDPKSKYPALARLAGLPDETPTQKAIQSPVARYDKRQRPRGTAFGWRAVYKKYSPLIHGVQQELSAEMRLLGYNPESL